MTEREELRKIQPPDLAPVFEALDAIEAAAERAARKGGRP